MVFKEKNLYNHPLSHFPKYVIIYCVITDDTYGMHFGVY
jgi:hypothetical protein